MTTTTTTADRKTKGSDLDYLGCDELLPTLNENHPFPRDVANDYSGRLLSKFLLSFTDEKHIFEPKI